MKVLRILFLIFGCFSLVHCSNQSGQTAATCTTTAYCSSYSTTLGYTGTTYGTTSGYGTSTAQSCTGNYLYYCPYGLSYGASGCEVVYCTGTNCSGYTLYTSSGQAVVCR